MGKDKRKYGELQVVEESNHWRIHDGIMHAISGVFTNTADSATVEMMMNVSANHEVHMAFEVDKIGAGDVIILKDVTVSANGSTASAYNLHDGKGACNSAIYMTPTNMTGTAWVQRLMAGSESKLNATGGDVRHDSEFIFEPGNKYGIRVTNRAGSATSIGIYGEFYEVND